MAVENVRLSASGATLYIVTSMAGIVFKTASLDHAVESAVGFCTLHERDLPPVTSPEYWPLSRQISMTASVNSLVLTDYPNNYT